jgi:antirestriction protein ArdC
MKTIVTDTYQRITDFVIEQLEKGEIVWQTGWNTLGLPKNMATGHQYKGWNIFFLNFITMYYGYKTSYFITYKQAMDLKGTIRRGQKGHTVLWWATLEDRTKTTKVNGEEQYLMYRVPKCHTVFNIDQTYGIEFPNVEEIFRSHSGKIHACDRIIENMPARPVIEHRGDKAYYNKTTDCITLPAVEMFHSDEAYYKTLFHELAHSTGHAKRLNRKELVESDGFGKELYSKEELTAELTAAFLCAISGIGQQTIINSTAYIQGWLSALKNDKRLILKASSQAQAAADYIRNEQPEIVENKSIFLT